MSDVRGNQDLPDGRYSNPDGAHETLATRNFPLFALDSLCGLGGILSALSNAWSRRFAISASMSSLSLGAGMLETPFRFEPSLTDAEFKKLGQLTLRWSHIEHIIGNCLKVMLRMTDEEAHEVIFPQFLDWRLQKMKALEKLRPLAGDAKLAFDELHQIMPYIQYVRSNVVHAIVVPLNNDEDFAFHLRSKNRTFSKDEILSVEEITNYAAHVVLSLRLALGMKDAPDARHPLPDRPALPAFLQKWRPIQNREDQQPEFQPQSSPP